MNTQSQPQGRALLLEAIVVEVTQRVNEYLDYDQANDEASYTDLEAKLLGLSQGLFAPLLQASVEKRQALIEQSPVCQCGRPLVYKGRHERHQQTQVGRVRWSRGYYYCAHCRQGHYLLDEMLGINPGQFSDSLQKGICRLGAIQPFEPAAQSFEALTGIAVSAREVERLTEGRGQGLEGHLAQEQEGLLEGAGPEVVTGPRPETGVWGASLDAAKIRLVDGWHEAKVGVVFWAQPEGVGADGPAQPGSGRQAVKARQQSYVVEVGPMERAGPRLYAEAVRRGIDTGEELVVCLGDGAPGNWTQFQWHFAQRVEVLDWWHAVEHLWAAGNGLFGEGTDKAKGWVESRKTELWEGRVEDVLVALKEAAGRADGRAAAEEIHYFESNQHRMHYDEYRAQGYPIGSGTAESACKRVIGARAKQAGMCWTRQGAQAVLSLRASLLSDRWDQDWQFTRPLPNAA